MGKRSSNRYSTKFLHSAKKSKTDAIKTASKRTIQKTAKGTDDLIRNKIAAKIIIKAEKSHQQELDTLREIYTSQEKRQQIINDLRLILCIIVKYQKITNLLDNVSNQPSKFRTKN